MKLDDCSGSRSRGQPGECTAHADDRHAAPARYAGSVLSAEMPGRTFEAGWYMAGSHARRSTDGSARAGQRKRRCDRHWRRGRTDAASSAGAAGRTVAARRAFMGVPGIGPCCRFCSKFCSRQGVHGMRACSKGGGSVMMVCARSLCLMVRRRRRYGRQRGMMCGATSCIGDSCHALNGQGSNQ